MKSKKKKIWKLNGEIQTELVNDALSIIDAAYESKNHSSHKEEPKKKNKPIKEIADAIDTEPDLNPIAEALGSRLAEKERDLSRGDSQKGTVNPLTAFLVKDGDDDDGDYDEQGEDERTAGVAEVVGEYIDGDTDVDETSDTTEGDDDEYDADDEELGDDREIGFRDIELYETIVPSRYILDDGITPVSFSVEYVETLDLRITRESILNAIKMLTGSESDDYVDDITSVIIPALLQFIAFTRHPSAAYTASEMSDYFGSFKKLPATEVFITNIIDKYFVSMYGPSTVSEMITASRGYAEFVKKSDHYDENLGEYGYIAKWFVTLARCAYTLSSMCAYEKPEYMNYLVQEGIVTADRRVVEYISNHAGSGRVSLQEIQESSDIENIESRFHVITDIEGFMNTMLEVIDVLTNSNNAFTLGVGNGFDQYEDDEEDDEMSDEERNALDEAMDEMFGDVEEEVDDDTQPDDIDEGDDDDEVVQPVRPEAESTTNEDITIGNVSQAPPADAAPKSISPSVGATSDNGSLRIPVRHRNPGN